MRKAVTNCSDCLSNQINGTWNKKIQINNIPKGWGNIATYIMLSGLPDIILPIIRGRNGFLYCIHGVTMKPFESKEPRKGLWFGGGADLIIVYPSLSIASDSLSPITLTERLLCIFVMSNGRNHIFPHRSILQTSLPSFSIAHPSSPSTKGV